MDSIAVIGAGDVRRALSMFVKDNEKGESTSLTESLFRFGMTVKDACRVARKDPVLTHLLELANVRTTIPIEKAHLRTLVDTDPRNNAVRKSYLEAQMPGAYSPDSPSGDRPEASPVRVESAVMNFFNSMPGSEDGEFLDIPQSRLTANSELPK